MSDTFDRVKEHKELRTFHIKNQNDGLLFHVAASNLVEAAQIIEDYGKSSDIVIVEGKHTTLVKKYETI